MNKEQKEILQSQLNNEKQTIKELKEVYETALKDCETKIKELSMRKDLENVQSIIYQKQYQHAIKGQLEGILEQMHGDSFATVSDYLARCYEDGFIGVMYDLAGQGIPLIMPIDQAQVVQAIQTDSKLSKTMYERLGEDVSELKKSVRQEVSRGIANGSSWVDVADNLAKNFKNTPFSTAYNNAIRIARTEGHRIGIQAASDAQRKAKSKGADVVKQWDATLDGRTRPTHRLLDGQIRELDDDFEANGKHASAPSQFGDPSEDINCRCALLQRARWALDDDELETLKDRAEYFGLDKTKDFEDYKSKFMEANRLLNAPEINDKNISGAKDTFDEMLKGSDGVERHVNRMGLYSEVTEYVADETIKAPFAYDAKADVIRYNPNAPRIKSYDLNYVQAHELSHRMDIIEYESNKNPKFIEAITTCRQKVLDNAEEIQTWFGKGGKYEFDFAMSDIISALSVNQISVPVGHDEEYWSSSDRVAFEIFANVSSIDVLGYTSKEEFGSLLFELFNAYKGIVE